jgi:uncharacterized integral membrane protein (TIGR00697 family)
MNTFIELLNQQPPEMLWILTLVSCFTCIFLLNRFFGPSGLYVYIVVAIIGANIQVLKAVKFSLYPAPVALGTILFSSAYLATDILGEEFGPKVARRGVWLGFIGYLFFVIVMFLTLGFTPLTPEQAGEEMAWALPFHDYIAALFTPQAALFAAGMIAFLTSQFHDVWLFDLLKRKTRGKQLWMRNNVSTMISALIDNTVFSVLAWIVFAASPLPFKTVLVTYIFGTYWLRLIVAALDTPFMYLTKQWGYRGKDHHRGTLVSEMG